MRSIFLLSAVAMVASFIPTPEFCAGVNTTAMMLDLQHQLANMTAMTESMMAGFVGGGGGGGGDIGMGDGLGGRTDGGFGDMNLTDFGGGFRDAGAFPNMTDLMNTFLGGFQEAMANMTAQMELYANCSMVMAMAGRIPENMEVEDMLGQMMANSQRFGISLNASEADDYVERLTRRIARIEDRQEDLESLQDSLRAVGALTLRRNLTAVYLNRNSNFTFVSKVLKPDDAVDTGRVRIRFPRLGLVNKTLSVVEWTSNPYKKRGGDRSVFSRVVSVQVADLDSGNATAVHGLSQEINITHYVSAADLGGATPSCVYWDVGAGAWSSHGCAVRAVSGNWVTCGCTHLTDFAIGSSGNGGDGKNLGAVIGGAVGGTIGGLVLLTVVGLVIWRIAGRRRAPILVKEYKNPALDGRV